MQANDGAIATDSLVRIFKLRKRKKQLEGPRIITALDGVDISVKQGELFGLLGPNGAGKTTLIKILCTLLLPTAGRAFVNGYDVVKESYNVREIISMVSGGESCGYGILTPRENLWLFSQFYGLTFKEAKENIDKMLDVVGLTEYQHTKMYELSTGMRQKINFARGFVTKPKIVFLDEPTLGLDVNAARDVRAFLKDWMAENTERTMILTTHYMAEADELCDRVAIIDRGKILACDSPANLKRMVSTEVTMRMETSPLPQHGCDFSSLAGVVNCSIEFDAESQKSQVQVVLSGERFVPNVIDYVKAQNASIQLLRISEPTLEDVFIKLVGRGLSTDTSVSPS